MAGDEHCGDEAIDGEDAGEDAGKQTCKTTDSVCEHRKRMLFCSLCMARSGRMTPADRAPILDLAMPYEAPKLLKTTAETHPIALKKGFPWIY